MISSIDAVLWEFSLGKSKLSQQVVISASASFCLVSLLFYISFSVMYNPFFPPIISLILILTAFPLFFCLADFLLLWGSKERLPLQVYRYIFYHYILFETFLYHAHVLQLLLLIVVSVSLLFHSTPLFYPVPSPCTLYLLLLLVVSLATPVQ